MREVLRYMFMPQIVPRLNQFYQAGFMQLAYMIALVYRAVNILPPNHPILQRQNKNMLTIRNVLGAAASELKFTRANIDKIIIYFAILLGIVLLFVQFFLLLGYVMMNPALAQTMPTTYGGFFATPAYETDVAYRILYMVFGVPELFYPANAGTDRPFHLALYSLFQLYSVGLLVVGVIIGCYMVFAVLIETAQTGVPFGKRFNHAWVPIRFIFAFGLLIPIGYGLNTAQWITLYAAKFGSDFATRGWIIFNDTMTDAYLSNPQQRVGRPQAPQLMSLVAYMMVVDACDFAYESVYQGTDKKDIEPYLVTSSASTGSIRPPTLSSKDFQGALTTFNKGDILIRFGEYNVDLHKKYLGNTFPYCGDLVIFTGDATEPGALSMQEFYYNLVRDMWDSRYDLRTNAENYIRRFSEDPRMRAQNSPLPDPAFKEMTSAQVTKDVEAALDAAVTAQASSPTWQKDAAQVQQLGWGGAGLWYNKIAQVNGSLVTAVNNVPSPKAMPWVMEYMKAKQLQQNTQLPAEYKSNLADGKALQPNSLLDETIGNGLSDIFDYWNKEDTRQDSIGNQTKHTNNIFIDAVNMIFGTRGLFDMCASADVHPLAQLAILGKGLVEASIRNLALAVGFGMAGTMTPFLGVAAGAASKILLSIATITISMGFILFYVIPFMPFLYFFFALGGWIKGLFEAMVGVPLWALAHLRIDGEGLPGDAAINGYFLIFEIFLRPILIIFGLLASVVIFAAMVKVLNEIFYLAVVNLAGHDENTKNLCSPMSGGNGGSAAGGNGQDAMSFFRGPIDEMFFTVVYAIIVYMIGMSCFKLIDLVPNNIMRYMNVSVNTFNDQAGDPADGLIARLSIGSRQVSGQLSSIGQHIGGAADATAKTALGFVAPKGK